MKRATGCLWIASLLSGWMAADAAIVVTYRGDAPNPLSTHGMGSTPFDIDVDGVADFAFNNSPGTQSSLKSEGENRFVGGISTLVGIDDYHSHVVPLEAGTYLGPGSVFPWNGLWHGSSTGSFLGRLLQPDNAYIGVEFRIGDNIHYGWIHCVDFNREDHPFLMKPPAVWVNSWAYNSIPGEPIHAGQIPEPSTPLLAGVAALAAAAIRRRK